ncbi:MAG TPA: TVP38/TMEM64 family protein [Longimicrobium sp.]|nr:TVP38/TMEM64 family protein [Longimicrobium sp.]
MSDPPAARADDELRPSTSSSVADDDSTEAGSDDSGRRGWDWKKVAIAAVFVGGIAAFFLLGGHRWLDFEALKANRARLLDYTERHYAQTILAVAAGYIVLTALSLPQATLLTLASGFLLGRWVGMAVVVVAATIGSTLAFLGARYLFAAAARRRMGPRLQRISRGFEEDAFSYLLFLRLVPLFPFWMVNLVPAFTPVKPRTYMAATFIGIIPGTFVFCNLGRRLATLESGRDLFDRETVVALAMLGLLSLVPIAWKKFRQRPTGAAA